MSDYPTPMHFRTATDMCVKAYNIETKEEVKVHLASAASLLAQVAEHLERGNSMTREIATHCSHVISLIHDEGMRTKIAACFAYRIIDGIRLSK